MRRFVSAAQLEEMTGVKRRTWQKRRMTGVGPRFYRIGGAIRYDIDEVLRWIDASVCDGEVR